MATPTSLLTAIATGGLAAGLALLALTVDETDEAFANIYSTAVSLQNVASRVPQRALIAAAGIAATVGALAIDLVRYEPFLFMLGSFFVPLFGVLLADWLVARRRYSEADIFEAPAVRPAQIAAWAVGFLRLPVASSGRARVVDRRRQSCEPARHRRRFLAELRHRVRSRLLRGFGVARDRTRCHHRGVFEVDLDDRARRAGSRPCRLPAHRHRTATSGRHGCQPARPSPASSTLARRCSCRTTPAARGGTRVEVYPPGFAVAVLEDDPDVILFAGRNRLYVSRDGGRFWEAPRRGAARHRNRRLAAQSL